MKIFILCGGYGTRLNYEGTLKAKPMIRIGKYPILKHIIDNFCDQGFNEFVLCLGHKSKSIIDYFLIENKKNSKIILKKKNHIKICFSNLKKKIFLDLVYTGKNSGTGGRLKIAYKKLKLNEDIFMTYGDGLSNVNINKVISFHYRKKALVTLTAVRPRQKYGILKIKFNKVNYFDNSNKESDVFINGGFFVISKNAINFIKENKTYWEEFPLKKVLKKKKLFSYKHLGFWRSLDTMKDKHDLNLLYKKNKFMWKIGN